MSNPTVDILLTVDEIDLLVKLIGYRLMFKGLDQEDFDALVKLMGTLRRALH